MRLSILLFFLLLVSASIVAQKEQHTLDFNGIDAFTLGMSKASVEKLVGKKIVFKHIGIDVQYTEDISVTYKNIPFELMMMRSEEEVARVESVSTKSANYKTKEGIGIGSDEATIINTYEKQLLIISKDMITLADINDIRSSIVFDMENKKVVRITVAPTAAFRDRE